MQKGLYVMTQTIEQSFNKAKDALRQINDDLFYNELKENLNQTVSKLEKEYSKTATNLDLLKSSMGILIGEFEDSFKSMRSDFVDRSASTLESMENKLTTIFEEQKENNNQVLDNFVIIQKKYLNVIKELERMQDDITKEITEFSNQQHKTLVSSTEHVKKQLNDFIVKQEATASNQLNELHSTFQQFMKELNKKYELHILEFTEEIQKQKQLIMDEFLTYNELFNKSIADFQQTINHQYEKQDTKLEELQTNLAAIQSEQKDYFKQVVERLNNKDAKDKLTHRRLIGIGIGIFVVQSVILILQFI